MRIRSEVFHVPKSGNTEQEYEDAFCPSVGLDRKLTTLRFAIADGATETSFASLWASLLVKAYCAGKLTRGLKPDVLSQPRLKWKTAVSSKALPWYAEEKLEYGAFSSLLGLTLYRSRRYSARWNAIAVGDSCLFHIHNNKLVKAFPITRSQEFNSRPVLIPTNAQYDESLSGHVTTLRGTLRVHDSLFLMTDALACWFLGFAEAGKEPWKLKRTGHFERWIKSLRDDNKLRNDDVTLVRIECLPDGDD